VNDDLARGSACRRGCRRRRKVQPGRSVTDPVAEQAATSNPVASTGVMRVRMVRGSLQKQFETRANVTVLEGPEDTRHGRRLAMILG
jgi:hypothetical protein